MVRKIFAVILFLYAAWQIFTSVGALTQGQGFAQLLWALLAILGGIYLLKKAKNK